MIYNPTHHRNAVTVLLKRFLHLIYVFPPPSHPHPNVHTVLIVVDLEQTVEKTLLQELSEILNHKHHRKLISDREVNGLESFIKS